MALPTGEGEDARAFHLGMCCAFIEMVGLGVKRLALSPPLFAHELAAVREAVEAFAEEFGVLTAIDPDPLRTRLFNPGFSRGRQVMLFALDEAVFAEYHALKSARRGIGSTTGPDEAEDDLARRFGRLLSYSEPAIDDLLRRPRF